MRQVSEAQRSHHSYEVPRYDLYRTWSKSRSGGL